MWNFSVITLLKTEFGWGFQKHLLKCKHQTNLGQEVGFGLKPSKSL